VDLLGLLGNVIGEGHRDFSDVPVRADKLNKGDEFHDRAILMIFSRMPFSPAT